jgi:hypothetical protein
MSNIDTEKISNSMHRLEKNIQRAKRELISEQTTRGYESDVITPKTPWKNTAAETLLKQMGASAIRRGVDGHDWQLVVPANPYDDVLKFSEDDTVWSVNQARSFVYTITGQQIEIKISKDDDAVAIITGPPVKWKLTSYGTQKSSEISAEKQKAIDPQSTGEKWLDYIQTALDWLGFIPGIGDAIDAVNAAVYFWRGKYFEGFLSMIAIIPVIGSVVATSAKTALKGSKKLLGNVTGLIASSWKSSGSARAAAANKLWTQLMSSKTFDPSHLRKLGDGFSSVADMLQSSVRPKIGNVPGISGPTKNRIISELDNFTDWLSANGKAIADIEKVGVKSVDKSAEAAKALNQINIPVISGLVNRAKSLFKLPAGTGARVNKVLTEKFTKYYTADPTRLTALYKLMGRGQGRLAANIGADFNEILKKFPPATQQAIFTQVKKQIPGFSSTTKFSDLSANQLNSLLDLAKNTPQLSTWYYKTGQTITKAATDPNSANIVWNSFRSSGFRQMQGLFSAAGLAWPKLSAKSADVIYNEFQDVFEKAGVKRDDPNGIIGLILSSAIASDVPGTPFSDKQLGIIRSIADNPWVQVGVGQVEDALGITPDAVYDPESEEEWK